MDMYTNHGCVIICQEHGKNFAGTMSKTFELSCLIAHFLLCSLYNILEKNLLLMYQKSKEKVKEDNFNAMMFNFNHMTLSKYRQNLISAAFFSFLLRFQSKKSFHYAYSILIMILDLPFIIKLIVRQDLL